VIANDIGTYGTGDVFVMDLSASDGRDAPVYFSRLESSEVKPTSTI
jgi:hypothetical protein